MLIQLYDFIKKFNMVSLDQLAREFKIDARALEPMLDIWVNKGFVKRQAKKLGCKKVCSGCSVKTPVYYIFAKNC
ncbi:MAG: hypothetical protein A3E88_00855 [Legionellales bacterium RIFCSPHIGHO2_12_FULL_35_11]|nr:MAG: hypothetical protein A3E88_00855 [Legionellales bacterium RIFCSPHIGHO2_12_FULL_35_11]